MTLTRRAPCLAHHKKTAAPAKKGRRFHIAAIWAVSGSHFTPCEAKTREAEAHDGRAVFLDSHLVGIGETVQDGLPSEPSACPMTAGRRGFTTFMDTHSRTRLQGLRRWIYFRRVVAVGCAFLGTTVFLLAILST